MFRALVLLALGLAMGCGPSRAPSSAPDQTGLTLTIVGTNDVHGRLAALPLLAGYVDNLRASQQGVLLVDAGDMLQGTLESNLAEGAPVISAYAVMGYDAAAIGNHELDFGPENGGSHPQGALRARIRQASFPMLCANLLDRSTGRPVAWPGLQAATRVQIAGIRVGLVGVLTEQTPHVVAKPNFAGLAIGPAADAVIEHARALRPDVDLVVVLAHLGGECERLDDPHDLSSCKADSELFQLADALPAGLVDVIVAGHTHSGVAHFVSGIAVVEAYSDGLAFSHLEVSLADGQVKDIRVHPPQPLCPNGGKPATCQPGSFAGRPVARDPRVKAVVAPAFERAEALRKRPLGVSLLGPIGRKSPEPPLGNLFADLLLGARPEADVAIVNEGGLRADLPAGALRYGSLYRAMPFDNRLALIELDAAQLRKILAAHFASAEHGSISIAGLAVRARCQAGTLQVSLRGPDGELDDARQLVIVTSDFLAQGGDEVFTDLEPGQVRLLPLGVRDELAAGLRQRREPIDPATLADPARPRIDLPSPVPVHCRP